MTSTSTGQPDASARLRMCHCCGLVQRVPAAPAGWRACCARCGHALSARAGNDRSKNRTAAIAVAALILYPLAVTLPILTIEQFGHANESSILEGTATLLSGGHPLVGLVVLTCSIILPLGKLAAMLVLAAGGLGLAKRHRAWTYRVVEWTGRWGMLDVLLVAVLVAALKLGDLVDVTPGPAALAFTACVLLSLLATATFDPHGIWDESETTT